MHELELADKLGVASHPTEVGMVNFPDADFLPTSLRLRPEHHFRFVRDTPTISEHYATDQLPNRQFG